MSRYDNYQQPEATPNNANARQWQIGLPKQDTGKVGNDSDVGGANDSKNANDTNHTSDQGEAVEVRVIKDSQDESDDRPGQVEQGDQAGRAVRVSTETQPKKKGIIELLGSSPLGVMAQTALDSVRHTVHEIQVDRQIELIDKTLSPCNDGAEAPEEYSRLNQLVDEDKIKLSDSRVLKKYLEHINRANDGRVVGNNTEFIKRLIQEDKIDLSKSEAREEYLKVALSSRWNSKRFGVQEAVDAGKLDLSNEEVTDQFLNIVGGDAAFNAYGIDLLKDSGISLEKIVDNEHIQQLAIERMGNIASKAHKDSGLMDELEYRIFGNTYLADVLDEVCSDEEGMRRLKESIDTTGASVQELGKSFEADVLDRIGTPSRDEISDEFIVDSSKCSSIFKQLGWEPFKEERSLAKLFCLDERKGLSYENHSDEQSIFIQDKAREIGLIDSSVVDQLYTYQYRRLLDAAEGGKYHDGALYNRLAGYAINQKFTPSGNNLVANYWHEQSQYLGADAMRFCMGMASDAAKQNNSSDISEFINDDGTMRDAFFQNRPGLPLQDIYSIPEHSICGCGDAQRCAKTAKFLEVHKDQASETDSSRAMIDLLAKMKDKNNEYDGEAMVILQGLVGSAGRYKSLFDANNSPTDKLYDEVLLPGHAGNLDYSKMMPYIDPGWEDHYSDAEKSYLRFIFNTDQVFVDEFLERCFGKTHAKEELRADIATYFSVEDPMRKLKEDILFKDAEFFYFYPEFQEGLSDSGKSLARFCGECRFSGRQVESYGLTPDNLTDYFDANGPTNKMIEEILFSDVRLFYGDLKLQTGLSDSKKSMIKFCGRHNLDNNYMRELWTNPR